MNSVEDSVVVPDVSDDTLEFQDITALSFRPVFAGTSDDSSLTVTVTFSGSWNGTERWYDPITGRWLSNDPIGISGGLNQYVFCGNNPVNARDPFGLVIKDPRASKLNFGMGDIYRSVRLAREAGITGPNGVSWDTFLTRLEGKEFDVTWSVSQNSPKPQTMANEEHKKSGSNIYFPEDACSNNKTKHLQGNGGTFYLEAAILHELTHAYLAMEGQFLDYEIGKADEREPVRIGNALNSHIDALRAKEAAALLKKVQ